MDNCSNMYAPTIEDRLENTEKLIQEMNNKFEDITSPKHSAKNEFNKLVQTLTMSSALQDYHADSDTDDEIDNFSDDSSFDEETLNLNQQNLKNYFKNENKKKHKARQNQKYSHQKSHRNNEEMAQFSNSRYEKVDEEANADKFYQERVRNYEITQRKAEEDDSNDPDLEESLSDQLYQNAKKSIKRRKGMLEASEQDSEFLDEISYSDIDKQVEMLNLSNKRVENILRNKEKRRNNQFPKGGTLEKLRNNERIEESDSCKIQMSSELDLDAIEESKGMKQRKSSRNKLQMLENIQDTYDNRYFHQTTSSGNLVLYDSVARTSTQSPQEMIDPKFIEQFVTNYQNTYAEQQYSDEEDLLQNDNIAGNYSPILK